MKTDKARAKGSTCIGSKNGFFCLSELGQKTLWVSAFSGNETVFLVNTPNLCYALSEVGQLRVRTLQLGVLQIVEGFAGSIVSEMVGRGRGGVGGNTTSVTADDIGDDGLSFVVSVQQCRFSGMRSPWTTLSRPQTSLVSIHTKRDSVRMSANSLPT